MTLKRTLELIEGDLRERAEKEGKPFRWFAYVKVLLNPPALAVIIYRFQHWLDAIHLPFFAEALRFVNIVLFTTDIGSKAVIGTGFCLLHQNGIVVTGNCRIGRSVYLVHHNSVMIGPRPGMNAAEDMVIIEDNVIVGCGARIMGNLVVGHDSFIGANEVVTTDIPPYSFFLNGTFAA